MAATGVSFVLLSSLLVLGVNSNGYNNNNNLNLATGYNNLNVPVLANSGYGGRNGLIVNGQQAVVNSAGQVVALNGVNQLDSVLVSNNGQLVDNSYDNLAINNLGLRNDGYGNSAALVNGVNVLSGVPVSGAITTVLANGQVVQQSNGILLNNNNGYNNNGLRLQDNSAVVYISEPCLGTLEPTTSITSCCSRTAGIVPGLTGTRCCLAQGSWCTNNPNSCCSGTVCASVGSPSSNIRVCQVANNNNNNYNNNHNIGYGNLNLGNSYSAGAAAAGAK